MRYLSYIYLLCFGLLLPAFSYATFIPNPAGINIYKSTSNPVIGNVSFSNGSTPWVSPVTPTTIDSNYLFHGNVWIDAVGWLSFDHGIIGNEVRLDRTCLISSVRLCPITGYLWSKNAGWIVFGILGDGGVKDVVYDKTTGKMSGYVWNTQLGWISLEGISFWPTITAFTGVTLSGGLNDSYTTTATGSMNFSIIMPDDILALGNLPTLQICPKNFPAYCYTYLYNATTKSFVGIDLSIATEYDYALTDPFGSKTIGTIQVYSSTVSVNAAIASSSQGLLQRLCTDNPTNTTLCPDGNQLRTTWIGNDLSFDTIPSGRRADLNDSYTASIHLRDNYGNPVISVPGIKQVRYNATIQSTLDYNSIRSTSPAYGALDVVNQLGGGAYAFIEGSIIDPVTTTIPSSPRIYSWQDNILGNSFSIKSSAPTSMGNLHISDNDINISSLFATVTGLGAGNVDISSRIYTDKLVFKPLIEVTRLTGIESIQLGRPTIFSGTIAKNDPLNLSSQPHIIHGLAIGNNTISSFQNLSSISPQSECISTTSSNGELGYAGYCNRTETGSKAAAISFAFDIPEQAFITTPRRLSSVDMIQSYIYDSVVTFKLAGHDITYPSLAITTNGSGSFISGGSGVVANMVKVIGQANGDTIFQTLTSMSQPKISSLSRVEIINQVRRNVSILMRNVSAFPYVASDYIIQKPTTNTPFIFNPVVFNSINNKKSFIVYGDIIIDQNFVDSTDSVRAIIALKDDSGNGGNIYIKKDVQRIDSSLIAESSLISGDSVIYYVDQLNAGGLLAKQLYIYGTIISQNTIGGASVPGQPVCPVLAKICSDNIATHYDLEHMRYYRDNIPSTSLTSFPRSARNLSIHDKKASLIIEYNSNILQDPPPGLHTVQ